MLFYYIFQQCNPSIPSIKTCSALEVCIMFYSKPLSKGAIFDDGTVYSQTDMLSSVQGYVFEFSKICSNDQLFQFNLRIK